MMIELSFALQILTCIFITIMYGYVGLRPKTHWNEKLTFNILSAFSGTALNIIAGFYYLIPMQFIAVYMGYLQLKAFTEVK